MLGDAKQARHLIGRAVTLATSNNGVAYDAVGVYEKLGERETALRHVAVALKAGTAPFEFESSPALAELVKDSRYVALTKQSAAQVNRR